MTLHRLISIVREQKTHSIVRKTVENILKKVPEKDWTGEIRAVFDYVKRVVRYTRDVAGVEYVKTPFRQLTEIEERGLTYGDCDDASLLLATLLASAGYKVRFSIIRTPTNPVPAYNHIYVEVMHPVKHKWISLDATMKNKPFGWLPSAIMKKDFYP